MPIGYASYFFTGAASFACGDLLVQGAQRVYKAKNKPTEKQVDLVEDLEEETEPSTYTQKPPAPILRTLGFAGIGGVCGIAFGASKYAIEAYVTQYTTYPAGIYWGLADMVALPIAYVGTFKLLSPYHKSFVDLVFDVPIQYVPPVALQWVSFYSLPVAPHLLHIGYASALSYLVFNPLPPQPPAANKMLKISVAVFIGGVLLNNCSQYLVDTYGPAVGPPAWDPFFILLPVVPIWADLFVGVLAGGCVGHVILKNPQKEAAIARLAMVSGIGAGLRAFTLPIFITVLTQFDPTCNSHHPLPMLMDAIMAIGVPNTECKDMMFSGHTYTMTLATLYLTENLTENWQKGALWCVYATGASSIVLSRYHYSYDVIVGAVLGFVFWKKLGKQVNIWAGVDPNDPTKLLPATTSTLEPLELENPQDIGTPSNVNKPTSPPLCSDDNDNINSVPNTRNSSKSPECPPSPGIALAPLPPKTETTTTTSSCEDGPKTLDRHLDTATPNVIIPQKSSGEVVSAAPSECIP